MESDEEATEVSRMAAKLPLLERKGPEAKTSMTAEVRLEIAAGRTVTSGDISEKKKGGEHASVEESRVSRLLTQLPLPKPPDQDSREVTDGEPTAGADRPATRKQEMAAPCPFGGSFLKGPKMEVKAGLYFDLMGQAQSIKEKEEFFKWVVAQMKKDAEPMKAEKENVDEIKRLIHLLDLMGQAQICEVQAQTAPSLAKSDPMCLDIVIVFDEVSLLNKIGIDMGPRLLLKTGVSYHWFQRVTHDPSRLASEKGDKPSVWERMLDLSIVWRNDLQRDSLGREICGDKDFYSEMTGATKHLHWEELLLNDEIGNGLESATLVECRDIAGGDDKHYQSRAQVAGTSRIPETTPQCYVQSSIYFKIWDPGGQPLFWAAVMFFFSFITLRTRIVDISSFDAMEVIKSSSLSLLCARNQHCLQLAKQQLMSSVRETASFTLGVISVIAWVVAEIPQITTNYRAKSAEGLSLTFLITWIIGDLFNLFGCMLEPATLPTQLYMAVLYTFITVVLASQTIYYGYIYRRLQYKKQLKHSEHGLVETPTKVGQSNSGVEKASDAEQSNEFDDFNRGTDLSSPIPLPALPQRNSAGSELFYQSARYLSKSHTPTTGSILAQRATPTSPFLGSIQEHLLGSSVSRQSAPVLQIKSTLCLVSTLTLLGAVNLLQSLDRRVNPMVSKPRQQVVIYVGRKLFQVSGDQFPENGAAGSTGIGTFLGWAMTFIYLGGRLPQICLNIRRGHAEGLNPLMFLFAVIGNATYVASILVSSLDWSRIKSNLPWLVDAGGCVLLDAFILMQFIYFHFWTAPGL